MPAGPGNGLIPHAQNRAGVSLGSSEIISCIGELEVHIFSGKLSPESVCKATEIFTACSRITGVLRGHADSQSGTKPELTSGQLVVVGLAMEKLQRFVTESIAKLKVDAQEAKMKLEDSGLMHCIIGDKGARKIYLSPSQGQSEYIQLADVAMLEKWDRVVRRLPLRSKADIAVFKAIFKAIECLSAATDCLLPWRADSWENPVPVSAATEDLVHAVTGLVVDCLKLRKYTERVEKVSEQARLRHLLAAQAFTIPPSSPAAEAVVGALEILHGIRYPPGIRPGEFEDEVVTSRRSFYHHVLAKLRDVGRLLKRVSTREMACEQLEALWPLYIQLGRYVGPRAIEEDSPLAELGRERSGNEVRCMSAAKKWAVEEWREVAEVIVVQRDAIKSTAQQRWGLFELSDSDASGFNCEGEGGAFWSESSVEDWNGEL